MNISVILATYGREALFTESLKSFTGLDTSSITWELIVVDNAGRKETARLIDEYSDRLPIRFLVEKLPGKNNALNAALPVAKGDLLVFTDNDVIADKYWLKNIYQSALKYSSFDFFGGKILPKFPAPNTLFDLNNIRIKGAFGIADWGNKPIEIPAWKAWGANLIIRSHIFSVKGYRYNPNIGPQGKKYAMGSEAELLDRLEADGFKCIYLPDALVYHQIERFQLTLKWLKARMIKAGRGKARRSQSEPVSLFLSMPRYLLKKLLFGLPGTAWMFFFNRKKYVEATLENNYLIGFLLESREKRQEDATG